MSFDCPDLLILVHRNTKDYIFPHPLQYTQIWKEKKDFAKLIKALENLLKGSTVANSDTNDK